MLDVSGISATFLIPMEAHRTREPTEQNVVDTEAVRLSQIVDVSPTHASKLTSMI